MYCVCTPVFNMITVCIYMFWVVCYEYEYRPYTYHFPLTETLPKPWPRMKPSPQRRAVSVHEDALLQHAALLDPEGELLFQFPHPTLCEESVVQPIC